MQTILLLLAACLIVPVRAGGHVATLAAAVESSCAPWDGAALNINVETIGLHVNLYGSDIQAFETGKVVHVGEKPDNMHSRATIKDSSVSMGFRQTSVELQLDPKTNRGHVVIKGSAHPVKFERSSSHAVCG